MKSFFSFIVLIVIAINAIAQEKPVADSNKWHFIIEPYAMFPNMRGSTGLGNLPNVEVDADAGDIFSHLQFGAMLFLEAHNAKWAITSDLLYMDLGQDTKTGPVIQKGKVDMKQISEELAGLYRVSRFAEVGLGARLVSLKMGVDLTQNNVGGGTTERSRGMTKTWVDPIIIARTIIPIKEKWQFQFRGDLGGFGVGSDFTWQIQAYAGYRFSKLFLLTAGYRVISIDYSKGNFDDRFLYDMNIFGPLIRFGFNL